MHLSDPAEDAANDWKKGTDEYECLHRIRPLYDSLRVACKAVYHPDKNLSVDERIVATKARISLKQYIKNKPTKWGIKLFVLCDSNGYTVDFNIYTGKSSVVSGKGLSFDELHLSSWNLAITFTVIIFIPVQYFSSTFITWGLEPVEPSGTQGLVSQKPK